MAAESADVGHMSHGDHNGETGSNASGSISRRKQQNHSNGLLIARPNMGGSATGVNNNSKLHKIGNFFITISLAVYKTYRCTSPLKFNYFILSFVHPVHFDMEFIT